MLFKQKRWKVDTNSPNKAFTMVELLVSISIIGLISGLVFWNGRKFNDKIGVTSVAEEVSLAIRQAQNYGVSVRESATGSGQFNYGYGVNFDISNPTFILLFADTNANKLYDGGTACAGGDECVQKVMLRNGVTINKLCAINSSGSTVCGATWRSIQAIFIRPNLDATINVMDNSGSPVVGPWTSGQITLSSKQGALKVVSIGSTGQISVQ